MDLVSRGARQLHPKGLFQAEGREFHQVQQKKPVFVFVGKPGLRKPLSGSIYRAPATVLPSRPVSAGQTAPRPVLRTGRSLAQMPCRRLDVGSAPEAPGRSPREAAGVRGAQRTLPALPLYAAFTTVPP